MKSVCHAAGAAGDPGGARCHPGHRLFLLSPIIALGLMIAFPAIVMVPLRLLP